MIKEIWNKSGKIKLYYVSMLLLYLYFAYTIIVGKRFTGSDSENWAPNGVHEYHHK